MDSHKKRSKRNDHVEDWKDREKKEKHKFHAVSMILSISNDLALEKDGFHNLKFSNGMVEGKGISINSNGDIITFEEDGSYKFEICGEGVVYSDVDVKVVYHSDKFPSGVAEFSETKIPREDSKLILRGIPTILPMKSGQTIVVRIMPSSDETIVIFGGTRLLIYRVA